MAKEKDKKSSRDSSQEQKAPAAGAGTVREGAAAAALEVREGSGAALMKELELKNAMAVPRLNKIVVNMGVGEATQNAKLIDPAVNELGQITGQKPVVTRGEEVDCGVQSARGTCRLEPW